MSGIQSSDTSPSKASPLSVSKDIAAKDDTEDASKPAPPVGKSKEEQIAELKAKRIEAIKSRIESLGVEVAATKEKLALGQAELRNPAEATVKNHIRLLHEYNEIRDIGQGLIGMVAGNRGVRISDVYGECGVTHDD